ncbi:MULTISPECIES: EpsG family protein [unclassified Methylophaga]|uniref:EpsG family protein n=2 Tax=Methylophaga TaxID=40222 RepID=UPI00259C9D5A|nr:MULTISPECIES: EpsG family protein [unclassified Methylophaga]
MMYRKHVWLIYPLLGLTAFLLSISASVDWMHYNWHYEHRVANQTWYQLFDSFSLTKEILFFWSSKLLGELIGFKWFIFSLTMGLTTLKLYYYERLSDKKPWLTIFFYCCFYLFLLEGTVLRVAYATAFVIVAIYFLFDKRPLLSFGLILLSSQIHLTCLVFLIIFPIYYSKYFFTALLVSFVLSPLFILFHFSLFDLIGSVAGYVNPKYQFYFGEKIIDTQNSTGLFFYFLAVFYALNLFVVYTLRNSIFSDPKARVLVGTGLMGIIFMSTMYTHVAPATRLAELMMITLPLYLTSVFLEWQKNKYYWVCYSIIIFAVLYALARFVYLYPSLIPFLK